MKSKIYTVGATLAVALTLIIVLFGCAFAQTELFHLKETTLNLVVSGASFSIEAVKNIVEDEIFISPQDPKMATIGLKLGSNYHVNSQDNVVTITRDADEYKIYLDDMRLEINKESSNMEIKSIVYKEKRFISFKVLLKLLGGQTVYDEKNEKYYCDPMINVVEVAKEKDRYVLKIVATGPVNFNYFYLRSPQRYVLDIQNAILVAEKKEIGNDDIGVIKYSQFNSKPNIVRFVIPLDKDIEVQAQPRTFLNQVIFSLTLPKVVTSVRNFSKAKIEEVSVKQYKDGVVVNIKTDVPIQYQWHRLKPPDNRMFLDIPDATLIGSSKEFKVEDNKYIENVKISQFQNEPKLITRIVLNFKKPAVCNVYGSSPNQLVVETKDKEDDEYAMSYSGAGVTSFPAKGKIICIDPGHGGSDSGAINRGLGIYEKDLNLDIAKRLSAILISDGWNVLMTRDIDQDVAAPHASAADELGARAAVANSMKADIFLSIHCNAMYDSSWNGTSSHWYKKIDYNLACIVQEALVAKIGLKNKGVIRNRFYVLRVTKMPAVLVECAFVSNYKEGSLLITEEFRQKIAEGIAEGLRNYISNE